MSPWPQCPGTVSRPGDLGGDGPSEAAAACPFQVSSPYCLTGGKGHPGLWRGAHHEGPSAQPGAGGSVCKGWLRPACHPDMVA